MSRYRIADERGTARLGAALAPILAGGFSIGLSGDLGAGKTTFVRYLVTAAGGDSRVVSSPTYTLQHEYPLPNGLTIEHWDLYRLTSLPLELEESTSSKVVRLIEWPERCPEIIDSLTCHMRFSHIDDDNGGGERILDVSGDSENEIRTLLDSLLGAA